MIDPFIPRVGGTMSADVALPQHARAVQFYGGVLTTGESPLWREDLMNNQGMPVIGIGERTPEYAALPLQWMPHVQVADVARSVERTLELGGSVPFHGKGDDGSSLWAVLIDPDGAALGLIPVVTEDQLPPMKGDRARDTAAGMGCIAGLDLTVANAPAACEFYREVVGWSVEDMAMQDPDGPYADYCLLGSDGNPAAHIRHARGVNKSRPPVWMLQLPVGDLAESLRRVREGGGKLLWETSGGEGVPAQAVVQDPVGACLALVPG